MDDLVAEHVIGVGERRRKRQRNPAPSTSVTPAVPPSISPGTIKV